MSELLTLRQRLEQVNGADPEAVKSLRASIEYALRGYAGGSWGCKELNRLSDELDAKETTAALRETVKSIKASTKAINAASGSGPRVLDESNPKDFAEWVKAALSQRKRYEEWLAAGAPNDAYGQEFKSRAMHRGMAIK